MFVIQKSTLSIKRIWFCLFLIILLLLTSCSKNTIITIDVDVLSSFGNRLERNQVTPYNTPVFLIDRQNPVNLTRPNPGFAVSGLDDITQSLQAVQIKLDIPMNSKIDGMVSINIYLEAVEGPTPTNAFDSEPVISISKNLKANVPTSLTETFSINENTKPKALAQLRSGGLRVGLKLFPESQVATLDDNFFFDLEEVRLQLEVRTGDLLPF